MGALPGVTHGLILRDRNYGLILLDSASSGKVGN